MDRVNSWAAAQPVASTDLNTIQDQAASLFQIAWTWQGRRPGLACNGTDLTVGQHHGCTAGTEQADAVRIPELGETGIVLSGLTPATWYFLYAYRNGSGDCAYEKSLTPPDDAGTYNPDDLTRAYVGCFYATGAGTALPFRMVGGEYLYRLSAIGSSGAAVRLLNGFTTLGTPTDVACAAVVPIHVRVVRLWGVLLNTAGEAYASIRTKGDTAFSRPVARVKNSTAYWNAGIELNNSREFQVELVDAGGSGGEQLSIYCDGFRE